MTRRCHRLPPRARGRLLLKTGGSCPVQDSEAGGRGEVGRSGAPGGRAGGSGSRARAGPRGRNGPVAGRAPGPASPAPRLRFRVRGGRAEQFRGGRRFRLCGPRRGCWSRARGGRERRAGAEGARGGGAGSPGPGGGPWGGRREAAACPGLGGWGERGGEMDKLTIISGCLFLAADIFAIASIANPDWINTGESAGERRARGAGWRTG